MTIDKISGFPSAPVRSGDIGKASNSKGSDASSSSTDAAAATDDTVSLDGGQNRLRELSERLAELPVVDERRVAELRQAIGEGRYQPDSERIADKLLAFESQLFGA